MRLPNSELLRWRRVSLANRGEVISYQAYSTQSVNPLTGAVSVTGTTTNPRALVGPLKRLAEGKGRTFRMLSEALPSYPPSLKDTISHEGVTYQVKSWVASHADNVVDIVGVAL